MKKLLTMFLVIVGISTMTACTTGEKQAVGVGGGAVVGGLAGSALTGGSVAGTVVGAGLGAWGGYELTRPR